MAGSPLMDPPLDRLVVTLNPVATLLHDDWYTSPTGGVGGDSERIRYLVAVVFTRVSFDSQRVADCHSTER